MNPYTMEVSRHFTGLRRADREAALADLEEVLGGGVTPAELGPAKEYARGVREQFGGRRFRLPGGFRFDRAARARVWAPQAPHLFVPRAFGIGWRVNLGNLAVRLGWLRPDDADADVIAAIPDGVRRAQHLAPVALGAGTVIAAGALWRTGRRIPVNFDLAGRVDRWADRRWLWALVAGTGAIAAWGTQQAEGEDAVIRPALATSATALTLTAACTALAAGRTPESPRPWVAPVSVLVPLLAELAATVLPVRAGRANVTKHTRQ